MKHGYIKIASATPHITVADTAGNAERIIELLLEADRSGARLVVFPELCITGCTAGDLLLSYTLIDGARAALKKIADATKRLSLIAFVGLPIVHGGRLFDAAAAICRGKILGIVPKTNIKSGSELCQARHFASAADVPDDETTEFFGEKIPFGSKLIFAMESMPCFTVAAEIGDEGRTIHAPLDSHCAAGAMIVVNPAACSETAGRAEYRRMLAAAQSSRGICTYIRSEAGEGESTTDSVFSGHNIIAEGGEIIAESERFTTGLTYAVTDVLQTAHDRMKADLGSRRGGYRRISFDIPLSDTAPIKQYSTSPFIPDDEAERRRMCEDILTVQAHGLKKRMEHTHAKTLIIGISGGLDSCLALLVCARAADLAGWDRKRITAVTMPCFGTTGRTRSNARILCEELDTDFRCINISNSVRAHLEDINHPLDVYDAAYENAQARERTQVLMDLANMENGLVIGTGDLSELALGWATYNGDHMSMYGVNGSIPKTLVRCVVGHAAETAGTAALKSVLFDILDTPVSPELLPTDGENLSQITEDLVGPYELHDFFLYYMLRFGFTPDKLLRMACAAFDGKYEKAVIEKWLGTFTRRFFSQQFKRSCLPDGVKAAGISLSPRGDWRMPSDASSALWLQRL